MRGSLTHHYTCDKDGICTSANLIVPSMYTWPVSREEVARHIAEVIAQRRDEVVAVYLFGSLARGNAGPDSDVDVAVLCGGPAGRGLAALKLDLAGDIERRCGRQVDLVVLDRESPDLVHRVLRDGILVLETDRSARIAFEVRARNEYFDLLPVLQRYRRPPQAHAA